MKAISLFIISILLTSLVIIPGIYAEGVSTDTNTDSDQRIPDTIRHKDRAQVVSGLLNAINVSEARAERARLILQKLYECDEIDNRTQRIECRLEIHNIAKDHSLKDEIERDAYRNDSRIPEACKRLDSREDCRKLYRAVNYCYGLEDPRQKNKCFKRVAGFVHSNLNDEDPNERVHKARKYIVFLLYDLQEKIEEKVSNGELTEEEGANLIAQIVEIKEDVLNGEPRTMIKEKITKFKHSFREAISDE